ncbi:MAG: hypothetical protein COC13_02510, partial [Methanobacteriota archaeon]
MWRRFVAWHFGKEEQNASQRVDVYHFIEGKRDSRLEGSYKKPRLVVQRGKLASGKNDQRVGFQNPSDRLRILSLLGVLNSYGKEGKM